MMRGRVCYVTEREWSTFVRRCAYEGDGEKRRVNVYFLSLLSL